MPTLPPFEGLHPLVVHFPIGLLLTVWIPALATCFLRTGAAKHWWFATVLWYALGVAGAMYAVTTGEAAADIVGPTTDEIARLLDTHEIRAEQSRSVFIISYLLTLAAVLVRYASPDKPFKPRIPLTWSLSAFALITYLVATRLLILAAHAGGQLVHTHGIHAPI